MIKEKLNTGKEQRGETKRLEVTQIVKIEKQMKMFVKICFILFYFIDYTLLHIKKLFYKYMRCWKQNCNGSDNGKGCEDNQAEPRKVKQQ